MSDKPAVEHKIQIAEHGAEHLPAVSVDSYNLEIRDSEGFVGDRANGRAFREILETWRERLRKIDDVDPLGEGKADKSETISKRKLDKVLTSGDAEAAGVVHSAIEDFAQELAAVVRRYLRQKAWADTEHVVVGGGFRESRIGELVIGRTTVLLKGDGLEIKLTPIQNHPDEAGLLGCAHLAPSWIFSGHDGILAVDIGGSNIRAGIIDLNLKASRTLAKSKVWKSELWRYAEQKPKRNEAIDQLKEILHELIGSAEKEKFRLAPFIGIGCPGIIDKSGAIKRGGQNLPGNWEAPKFNLPHVLHEEFPQIDGNPSAIVMHNDAVVQGLSEAPFMDDVKRWGVLTIGTGLGNARFTNVVQKD